MANQGPGNENVMMEDIFQAINASDKAESPPLHLVTSISPNDWVMALNNDILNKSGKKRLAEACKHNPAFYHVAFRLLEQTSLGIALAREILEDDNWSKYQEMCEEYNIKNADSKEKMINALGRLLVSKKLVFWSLNILFSKSAVRGFLSLFRDADVEVRRKALEAMETYDIELSEPALVMALDDSDKKVRTAALGVLKKRLLESRLIELLAQDFDQTRTLGDSAKRASEAILSAGLNMPGVKHLLPYLRSIADGTATIITDGAASVGSAVGTAASSVSTSINATFRRLTRKTSKQECESPDSLFALYVALAWTDGVINESERQALNNLIKDKSVNKAFDKWLAARPDLAELEPFLSKLKNPQAACEQIAKDLGIDFYNLQDQSWLIDLESLFGIAGKLVKDED